MTCYQTEGGKRRCRSYLFVLCLFASIPPVLPLQAKAAVTTNAGVAPDHVTLTWTQDPQTTQTVTWRTGLDTDRGRIQYAKQVDHAAVPANAQTASSTTSAFNTNIGNFNIHSVTATKLDPGTVYVYRVGDGTNWSEIHAFTTEAATTDAFKFLIFGDRQSGRTADPNYSPWRTCVQTPLRPIPMPAL